MQEISGYRRNARRAEAAGVGVHQLFSFGTYLKGDDGEMGELQAGFDGDGTGTETDVPEDAAAVQFQCLQGEQADGGLGYHAGASVKMCKLLIGDAEGTDWKVRSLYAAVQGGCAALPGMADKQQAVRMFEVAGNRFLGCHPAYAFLFGIAEMLADV